MTDFARSDGALIAYEVTGEGPAIVLIHAGVADRHMWDDVVPLLAGTHRVVTYDLRGFGETVEEDEQAWRPDRDLFAVMDAAGVETAVLAGVSMGGGTAIDAALIDPQRVEAVVAVNPGLGGFRADHGEWAVECFEQMSPAWEAGDMETVARLEMEIWLAGPPRNLDEMPADTIAAMRECLLVSYGKEPWERSAELDPPAAERLGELQMPMLAVLGEHDLPSLAATVDHLAEHAPGCTKVIMPGVAHLAPWEDPVGFVRILRAFLDDA